jgi:phosphinothricin acetyltransferase
VLIRPIEARDVEAVAGIYAHNVLHGTGTFELDPPSTDEMTDRIDTILAAGLPYLVADLDGVVAGFAYAGSYRTRPAYANTIEDSIYLSPEAFGRRIGTGLLTAVLTASESWGARQVVAVIGDSDNRASIRLHEKCGFTQVGTLRSVGWKFDRWLDTVIMQRALGPSDGSPAG